MEKFYVSSTPNTTATAPNTSVANTTTPNTSVPNTSVANTTTPNIDPMIIEDANPIELKSPKKENDDNDEPLNSKKKPTRNSDVWEHFTKVKGGDPNEPRCKCNYCGKDYACHTTRVGTSSLLSAMAASMKSKYDKYWGNADNINPLLFLAVVLDPRYKMRYLKYCFESVYDVETIARIVIKVESILQLLYACYNVGGDGEDGRVDSPPKTVGKEIRKRKLLENFMQQQEMETTEKKNDIDVYLAEESLKPMINNFNILLWWKDNASRYKTLSMIAKDKLAIPVSTVASESAFSTSGRILDPFRSSLSPKMLEALICTQSWLKGNHGGIKSNTYLDESLHYDFLERGADNKGKMKDNAASNETKTIDVIDD